MLTRVANHRDSHRILTNIRKMMTGRQAIEDSRTVRAVRPDRSHSATSRLRCLPQPSVLIDFSRSALPFNGAVNGREWPNCDRVPMVEALRMRRAPRTIEIQRQAARLCGRGPLVALYTDRDRSF